MCGSPERSTKHVENTEPLSITCFIMNKKYRPVDYIDSEAVIRKEFSCQVVTMYLLASWSEPPWLDNHDDVIKWKHFLIYWSFVRGIHRFPVNSPHKGQWRGALKFSLICVWINGWENNREAGDLRSYRAHYDVIVMANHLPAKCSLYWLSGDISHRRDLVYNKSARCTHAFMPN